jgi:hypothetical protein
LVSRALAAGVERPRFGSSAALRHRNWMRLGPMAKSPRRLSPETPLLKELESENARLKRIVADKRLHIEALKELGRGNW